MSETRALLLTDVVDSTKLSEQLGDEAMAALWAKHDRLARDLLRAHRGREIDKTDGFLMLFTEASDAVAYAVAYHRALAELGIAARAGLHVGVVILTENAAEDVALGAKPLEVDGIAKPTAARVMGIARGGQTLLTPSAVEALGPTQLRIASHGHWRLKGVAEPMELFEVGDESAPFEPPPDGLKVYRVVERDGLWLPIREVQHSLPAERDAFVGRRDDLKTLAERLEASRLVSVLGIGGTGKTRLVTRFGWTWLGDHPGGVWFCDLSEARSLEGILSAVAGVLDVPLDAKDPVVQLGNAMKGRGRCLVVLDNFEQVARFAAETVGTWLDRASEARFVVTTREVLGLPGESALPLAPLAADDSVALFVARARQAKPDFEPTDAASIEGLVALLDRLPLAIELAAARVRLMPPKTLLERMSQRFRLLASRGGRHTRQATLRGALDWSWDLLEADEQGALAQLSVFEGGFTLEAAEAVLVLVLEALWPMDAVQALVDKSLVRQVSDDRFDLLVSVQEYAAEKLEETGDRSAVEQRHGEHYAALGSREAMDALRRHGGLERARVLARELDNLVVACRRAAAARRTDLAVRALRAVWANAQRQGGFVLVLELVSQVLPACAPDSQERADALVIRADVTSASTYHSAIGEDLEAALALYRTLGNRRAEGRVLARLGLFRQHQTRLEQARAMVETALANARETGDLVGEVEALQVLASIEGDLGQPERAVALYASALEVIRTSGDRRGEGVLLGNLGIFHAVRGRVEEAADCLEESRVVSQQVGDRRGALNVQLNLGGLYGDLGEHERARRAFEPALEESKHLGDPMAEAFLTCSLGRSHALLGDAAAGRARYEEAIELARRRAAKGIEAMALQFLGDLERASGQVDAARECYGRALSCLRSAGPKRMECTALTALGGLALDRGELSEAHARAEAAERLARELEVTPQLVTALSLRARLAAREGHLDTARGHLAEARELAEPYRRWPESDLNKALAEAARALDQADQPS